MNNSGKVEEFKRFVKNNSFLISYIKSGEMSWQNMYEIYDLYGEDEEAWDKFLNNNHSSSRNVNYFEELVKMAKNIDVNKVQEGITSLQKTLGLFGELFASKENGGAGREYNPRPLYRRFED